MYSTELRSWFIFTENGSSSLTILRVISLQCEESIFTFRILFPKIYLFRNKIYLTRNFIFFDKNCHDLFFGIFSKNTFWGIKYTFRKSFIQGVIFYRWYFSGCSTGKWTFPTRIKRITVSTTKMRCWFKSTMVRFFYFYF